MSQRCGGSVFETVSLAKAGVFKPLSEAIAGAWNG